MIEIRPFASLGRFHNEWLTARHHFSFGSYHEPSRMGMGGVRVWNDDEIAPGRGFDPHPHHDMEIVTYVRAGAITHRDSLGNEGRTEAGDVQVMHAGTGITHAEYNLESEPTRLFQIWLRPNQNGVAPGWQARRMPERGAGLTVLASGDGEGLPLHADAAVLAGRLAAGERVEHHPRPGRDGYLVPAIGRVLVNGVPAGERDGVAFADEAALVIEALDGPAELVLVEAAREEP